MASGTETEGLWITRRRRLKVRNGMMENMSSKAERRRKALAVRRNRPQSRYRGAKKAAQEKAEMRNRPGAPKAEPDPAAARTRETNDAAHNTPSALDRTSTAGENLLPKTVTLPPS